MMKKIFCSIALCSLFYGVVNLTLANGEATPPAENQEKSGFSGQKEEMKAVIARVNGVDLSLEELIKMEDLIRTQREQAAKAGVQAGDSRDIWGEALDRLILQELMYQKAKALGMKVEEKDIDDAILNFKKNFGGEEEYKLFLDRGKITEKDLRREWERGQILKDIYTKEVYDKAVVTEEDLRAEYDREKRKFIIPEKIEVTDVVFFLDINDKKSLEKAEEVLKKILAEENRNPSNLAPDSTFIVRDYTLPADGDKVLSEAAKKLKEGEVSGVIKTGDSFHIIKLMKYSAEKQYTFDEVRGMIEKNLRAQARQKRADEWKAELKKAAKIEILSPGGPGEEKGK